MKKTKSSVLNGMSRDSSEQTPAPKIFADKIVSCKFALFFQDVHLTSGSCQSSGAPGRRSAESEPSGSDSHPKGESDLPRREAELL